MSEEENINTGVGGANENDDSTRKTVGLEVEQPTDILDDDNILADCGPRISNTKRRSSILKLNNQPTNRLSRRVSWANTYQEKVWHVDDDTTAIINQKLNKYGPEAPTTLKPSTSNASHRSSTNPARLIQLLKNNYEIRQSGDYETVMKTIVNCVGPAFTPDPNKPKELFDMLNNDVPIDDVVKNLDDQHRKQVTEILTKFQNSTTGVLSMEPRTSATTSKPENLEDVFETDINVEVSAMDITMAYSSNSSGSEPSDQLHCPDSVFIEKTKEADNFIDVEMDISNSSLEKSDEKKDEEQVDKMNIDGDEEEDKMVFSLNMLGDGADISDSSIDLDGKEEIEEEKDKSDHEDEKLVFSLEMLGKDFDLSNSSLNLDSVETESEAEKEKTIQATNHLTFNWEPDNSCNDKGADVSKLELLSQTTTSAMEITEMPTTNFMAEKEPLAEEKMESLEMATNVEVFEITYDEEERNHTGPAYEITRPIGKMMIEEDQKGEDMSTGAGPCGSIQKGRLSLMPIPPAELHSLSFSEFDPNIDDYKQSTRIGDELRGADSSVQQISLHLQQQPQEAPQPQAEPQPQQNAPQPQQDAPQQQQEAPQQQQGELQQQQGELQKQQDQEEVHQPQIEPQQPKSQLVEASKTNENVEPIQEKQHSPPPSRLHVLNESNKENADEDQAQKIKLPPGGWEGFIPSLGVMSAKRPGPLEPQSVPPNKKMNIGAELLSFKPPPPPTHLKTGALMPKSGRVFGSRLSVCPVAAVPDEPKLQPKSMNQTIDQENVETIRLQPLSIVMKPAETETIAATEKQRDTGVFTQYASLFRKSRQFQTQHTQVQEITMDFTKMDNSQAEKTKEDEEESIMETNEEENDTMQTQGEEAEENIEQKEEAGMVIEDNDVESSVVDDIFADDNSSSVGEFNASAFNISLIEPDFGAGDNNRKSVSSSLSIRVSMADGLEETEVHEINTDSTEDDSSIVDQLNVTNFERSIWQSPQLGDRTLANINSLNQNDSYDDQEQLTQYLDLAIDANFGDSSGFGGNNAGEKQRQLRRFAADLDLRSMSMRIQALETDQLVVRFLWSTLEFRIRFGAPVRCSSSAANNNNNTRGLQLIAEREIISVDVISLYDGVESPQNMFSQLVGEKGTKWEPLINGDWYTWKFKTPEDVKVMILAQDLVMEQFEVLRKTLCTKYPTSRSLVGLLKELSRIVQTPRSLCLELSFIVRFFHFERFEIQPQPGNVVLELRVQGLRNYITFKVSLDPRTYPYQALKPSLEWPEKDNKYYSDDILDIFNQAMAKHVPGLEMKYLSGMLKGWNRLRVLLRRALAKMAQKRL